MCAGAMHIAMGACEVGGPPLALVLTSVLLEGGREGRRKRPANYHCTQAAVGPQVSPVLFI